MIMRILHYTSRFLLKFNIYWTLMQIFFSTHVSFPPSRPNFHSIPLIPGFKHVQIRPYRYTPHLKDEIEKQVHEMLEAGLIQPSCSPFSTLVLLVKKKNKTYMLYVGYRYLNVITMKGQFPVPIIEELLDELKNDIWFSTLDLCVGFHQIYMDPGDAFKTAFQTHSGHYEFRAKSFGLTRAPHSFQKAMNSVLLSLLRK
jgi:hypothetical protein